MSSRCGGICQRPACVQNILDKPKVATTLEWMSQNSLLVATAVGVLVGLVSGTIIRDAYPSDDALILIGFPGECFLRILKMLTLPLIISSLVTGTTALDPKTNGRLALMVLLYFFVTSLISAIIGVFLVLVIHPGHPEIKESIGSGTQDRFQITMFDTFMDLFRNAIPENVVEATLRQVQTHYVPYKPDIVRVEKNVTTGMLSGQNITLDMGNESISISVDEMMEYKRVITTRDQMNALGLIVFFMTFGASLSTLGARGRLLENYFIVLNKIIMKIVKVVIWVTPIGVASLICERMASLAHLMDIVNQLGLYMVTVIIGLIIHQFILLPAIYYALIRRNPFRFWWNLFQAFLTAFATESSAAALPVTLQNMEEKNGANKLLTRFMIPIGTTINMNGTAMFVAIASIFIAQMNAVEPSIAEVITIVFTATAVSIASSATPSASLFLMVMTLSVMPEVPISDVSLLFAIDWLLGRCRTTNNIIGDCYAVAVFQHFYGKELEESEEVVHKHDQDLSLQSLDLDAYEK